MPTFWKPACFPLTDVFIETGTQRGDSLAAALGAGYPLCMSVEFTDLWFQFASNRFAGNDRVRLFQGSSPEILPVMIDPSKSTTFWLDAHFCGNDRSWQDPRYGECPLLAELEVILGIPWRTPPYLCIDDAFIFREAAWHGYSAIFNPSVFTRSHWPSLPDLEKALPGYELQEENYVLFCQKKADH